MKTKALLFNSPKNVGKTYAINYLRERGFPLTTRSCKDHLHELTMKFFNVEPSVYWKLYESRMLKEEPNPLYRVSLDRKEESLLSRSLGGNLYSTDTNGSRSIIDMYQERTKYNLSPREALIHISEVVMKPRMGSDYFGVVRANNVQEGEIIVDDSASAFEVDGEIVCDEIPPLVEKLGQENVLLIRVHREGYTFEGDSRRYIPDGVCDNTQDIYNNGAEEDFYKEVEAVVRGFLYD